jgi:hypothetical protein
VQKPSFVQDIFQVLASKPSRIPFALSLGKGRSGFYFRCAGLLLSLIFIYETCITFAYFLAGLLNQNNRF